MYFGELLHDALDQPFSLVTYHLGRCLAQMFPNRVIVEACDWDFTITEYAKAGLCRLRKDDSLHAQVVLQWNQEKGILEVPRSVWYEVDWREHCFDLIVLEYECERHCWIVAEDEQTGRKFFQSVCEWQPELNSELLVFDGGHWDQNAKLFKSIQGVGLDELVLAGALKNEIRADLERFFASKELYESLGAPWKRGLLLTGAPGNGKTHTIKALVNVLGKPCLYVKSFQSDTWIEQTNIRRIFARARRVSPCLMVFEDLDSLVTNYNRSFFLNELDGFAANAGIAIVATTNHPEKLDPAIVQRPSRFDRKYEFALPAFNERRTFIEQWLRTASELVHIPSKAVDDVAERTEGFSFAYLKELFLASVIRQAADEQNGTLAATLLEQVDVLRASIGTEKKGKKKKKKHARKRT
jgi:AAA+ superfamily predicted ATPase